MTSIEKKNSQYTWAQAWRDIVVTSINRGQLPVLGMIVLALLIVYRMPEPVLAALVGDVVESLKRGELWSYIIVLCLIVFWYLHTKAMRKAFSEEAERIGREKSRIQSKAAGVTFKSSDKVRQRKDKEVNT